MRSGTDDFVVPATASEASEQRSQREARVKREPGGFDLTQGTGSPLSRDDERKRMFKIQTLNNISRNGLDRLPATLYRVANDIAEPDAVLVRSADMRKSPIAPSVKAVARASPTRPKPRSYSSAIVRA